jgi:hypothetical protein
MTREFKDRHIGTFKGIEGMERLRREADNLLRCSSKIVIAVSGYLNEKCFVKFCSIRRLASAETRGYHVQHHYRLSLELAWKKLTFTKKPVRISSFPRLQGVILSEGSPVAFWISDIW